MKLDDMLRVSLMAALTAAGAWVAIPLPFTPVPFSLQVLFALLSGAVLGPRLGALSQLVYIALGAVGLPVFAGGRAGIATLWGPTGGYLIGFVVAAYVIGSLSQSQVSLARRLGSMVAGVVVIHALGVAQLALVMSLSITGALAAGSLPFIVPDLVKAGIGALVAERLRAVRPGFAPREA